MARPRPAAPPGSWPAVPPTAPAAPPHPRRLPTRPPLQLLPPQTLSSAVFIPPLASFLRASSASPSFHRPPGVFPSPAPPGPGHPPARPQPRSVSPEAAPAETWQAAPSPPGLIFVSHREAAAAPRRCLPPPPVRSAPGAAPPGSPAARPHPAPRAAPAPPSPGAEREEAGGRACRAPQATLIREGPGAGAGRCCRGPRRGGPAPGLRWASCRRAARPRGFSGPARPRATWRPPSSRRPSSASAA